MEVSEPFYVIIQFCHIKSHLSIIERLSFLSTPTGRSPCEPRILPPGPTPAGPGFLLILSIFLSLWPHAVTRSPSPFRNACLAAPFKCCQRREIPFSF